MPEFQSQFGTIGPTGGSSIPKAGGGWLTAGPGYFQPVNYNAPTTVAPPPNFVPAGAVSNWKDFMQGLLGTGVQYFLQKDAQKRADKLQSQGVPADVIPHPGGGYSVVERPSFIQTPAGLALILGGGVLVVYLLMKKR